MQRISTSAWWLAAVIALAGLAGGCGEKVSDQQEPNGALSMDQAAYESWEIALVEMRIEKNETFSIAETSPLQAANLEHFEGLNYFFPAPALRFRVPFLAAAGTDTVVLTKRKGNQVPYLRRGTVSFTYGGKQHTLPVFGPVDPASGAYLWLPFTDKTTGTSTYGGGRYLDVTVDEQGLVDLDFNYAYNPLCDYNPEQYNCTLPPADSHLDFAVEAGEKSWHLEP